MAQSSMEPMTVSFYLRECGAILVGALGVFLFLAIFSYNPGNPSATALVSGFSNITGSFGAAIAFGTLWAWGIVSFLLPIGMVGCATLVILWRNETIAWQSLTRQSGGAILFVICACTLVDLYVPAYSALPNGSGGAMGVVLVQYSINFVEVAGLTLTALVFALISLQLIFGFSWLMVLEYTGAGVVWTTKELYSGTRWVMRAGSKGWKVIWSWAGGLNFRRDAGEPTPSVPAQKRVAPKIAVPQVDKQPNSKPSSKRQEPTIEPARAPVKQGGEPVILSRLPSIEILSEPSKDNTVSDAEKQALVELSERLREILADYGVSIEVESIISGPVVSRFEIQLAPGLKVSKIISLANDLAREIAVSSVRVVPVVTGKSVVGIEIPNRIRAMVTLREVLSCPEFEAAKRPLTLALGKDISGEPVYANLERMPHLLVAGTTGSGKSVGINTMLLSLLYRLTPEDVRLILVDPKMLELSVYEGIPHLLTPVVTDMQDAAKALQWCVAEMERRYRLMMELKVRNLGGYNEKIEESAQDGIEIPDPLWDTDTGVDQPVLSKLPLIVVVIDEFADMIMIVGKKIEQLIARIAQKARAAGIHLVLATQRPSVDVITGLIKANIPSRISYQVSSQVDSRTILDQVGAEQLLGHGDMLYLPPGSSVPERVHGAFVSDDEVLAVIEEWRQRGEPEYVYDIVSDEPTFDPSDLGIAGLGEDGDDLYQEAVRFVVESRRASASALQTKFQIGWNKAARFMDQMAGQGIVSEPDHKGRREVLAAEE